jgi:hypothetical protein
MVYELKTKQRISTVRNPSGDRYPARLLQRDYVVFFSDEKGISVMDILPLLLDTGADIEAKLLEFDGPKKALWLPTSNQAAEKLPLLACASYKNSERFFLEYFFLL